jgi:hypothetical protein
LSVFSSGGMLRHSLRRRPKEITHDRETGAPKLKLQDNLQTRELARKAWPI